MSGTLVSTYLDGINSSISLPIDNIFFTYDTHKKPDGHYYVTDSCKYNSYQGITGHMIQNDVELVVDNNPRSNEKYAPEVDNCGGSATAKNIIFGKK